MSVSSFDIVPHAVANAQITKYTNVAALSVLVYDYIITFETERNFIWKSKWSATKVLFVMSRYLAFVEPPMVVVFYLNPIPGPQVCALMDKIIACLVALNIASAEAILILRTYAIWNRSKKVLYGLLALFLSLVIAVVTLLLFETECNAIKSPGAFFTCYVLLLLLETVILSLTLYQGFQFLREKSNILLVTLMKDGILYFLALLAASMVNIVTLAVLPREYAGLFMTFQSVLHNILACRLVLHLRVVGDREYKPPTQLPIELSLISFCEMPRSTNSSSS